MSSYKPYPIYDLKTGLYLAKQPWLVPRDAFVSLFNARIYQGRIIKRKGSSLYGKVAHQVRAESIGASGVNGRIPARSHLSLSHYLQSHHGQRGAGKFKRP